MVVVYCVVKKKASDVTDVSPPSPSPPSPPPPPLPPQLLSGDKLNFVQKKKKKN